MEKGYIKFLACPKCNIKLRLKIIKENEREVLNGKLYCATCSNNYRIDNGIPILYYGYGNPLQESVLKMYDKTPYGFFGAQDAIKNHKNITMKTLQNFPWYLQQNSVKGKLVLEAGCGGGHLYTELFFNKANVIGLDQSLNSLRHIQKLFRENNLTANLVFGNIEYIPFVKNAFDIITSMGVIHHTPDTQGALLKLSSVLKVNGVMHIMVYHKDSAWNYIKNTLRFVSRKSNLFRKILFSFTKYWQGITAQQSDAITVFRDNIINPITKSFSASEFKQMAKNCGLKIIILDKREIPELYIFGKSVYHSPFLRWYEKRFGWFLYAKLIHNQQ